MNADKIKSNPKYYSCSKSAFIGVYLRLILFF